MSTSAIKARLLGALFVLALIPVVHAQVEIPGLDPLEPIDVRQQMQFGSSVGISGSTALVGAPAVDGHGAAYVFTQKGTSWTRTAKLLAPDIAPGNFGTSIAFDGTALIGDSGRHQVYYFTFDGKKWKPRAILKGGAEFFGYAMAMEGCTAVITSSYSTNGPAATMPGFVHVFDRCSTSDGNWKFIKSFNAPGTRIEDQFGASIALSGTNLLVGAPRANGLKGVVYWFAKENGNWNLKQKLVQVNPQPDDSFFGYAVGLQGTFAVIGAPRSRGSFDTQTSGLALAFRLTSNGWTSLGEIIPNDGTLGWSGFGSTIIVTADRAIIGAPDPFSNAYDNGGNVFAYQRSGDSLTFESHLGGLAFAVSGHNFIGGEYNYRIEPGTNYGIAFIQTLSP